MRKTFLTVLVTAAVCFAIAATTGFAAKDGQDARRINMKVGDLIVLQSANVGCRALAKTTVACGANTIAGSKAAYITKTQIDVVQFNKAGTKATVLFKIKR